MNLDETQQMDNAETCAGTLVFNQNTNDQNTYEPSPLKETFLINNTINDSPTLFDHKQV